MRQSPDNPPAAIVLIGAPGAGKTTIGAELARTLGVNFFDSDVEIERTVGKPVQSIFVEDGEPFFRDLEQKVAIAALESESGVISLGGGAVLNDTTREVASRHLVIWLQVSAATAANRIGLDKPRPVLLGNVRSSLVKLLSDRNPIYQSIATCAIETDDKSPALIVEEIMTAIDSIAESS